MNMNVVYTYSAETASAMKLLAVTLATVLLACSPPPDRAVAPTPGESPFGIPIDGMSSGSSRKS